MRRALNGRIARFRPSRCKIDVHPQTAFSLPATPSPINPAPSSPDIPPDTPARCRSPGPCRSSRGATAARSPAAGRPSRCAWPARPSASGRSTRDCRAGDPRCERHPLTGLHACCSLEWQCHLKQNTMKVFQKRAFEWPGWVESGYSMPFKRRPLRARLSAFQAVFDDAESGHMLRMSSSRT